MSNRPINLLQINLVYIYVAYIHKTFFYFKITVFNLHSKNNQLDHCIQYIKKSNWMILEYEYEIRAQWFYDRQT